MKRKHLLSIILVISLQGAMAQGVWTGQNPNSFIYNFERTVENPGNGANNLQSDPANAVQSLSALGDAPAFLPFPTTGAAKVILPANSGAYLSFDETGPETKLNYKTSSLNGGAAPYNGYSKLSIYKNTETTPVTSIFFTLRPNQTTSSGRYFILFGNTPVNEVDGASFYSGEDFLEYYTNGQNVFGGLKFDFYPGEYPGWGYKNGVDGFVGVDYNGDFNSETGTPLTKNIENQFEIYCNNFNVPVTYVRDAQTYTVAVGSYQIWVNGARKANIIANAAVYDFPASPGEFTANTAINSIAFLGDFNSGDLEINTSRIVMSYVTENTLPVTFTSFTGSKNVLGVQLNFSTSSETNNSHFEIFRKTDDSGFVKIGRVYPNQSKNYVFNDDKPLSGTNYYKVVQVDESGKETAFDKIVNVKNELKDDSFSVVSVENSVLKLAVTSTASNSLSVVTLTDLSGKVLVSTNVTLEKGNNIKEIKIPNLIKGVYIISLSVGNDKRSLKFLN